MITVEINDTQIRTALDALQRALSDMTSVNREIGETMVRSTQDRMVEGKSPDGKSFAPRSAVTIARYKREGQKYGAHPLWLTGTMRQNIAYSARSDQVSWGSNAVQAAVMHFGAEQGEFGAATGRTKPSEKRARSQDCFVPLPWGKIPARPFLGLSDKDRTDIFDIIGEWLETATKA